MSKRGWTAVSMPKFLIITADDFGLHEAVNDAVEQRAVGQGQISSEADS
jgi:predicted glycoside hydrolase/deacetylase ChbG (UPF0249 family)